MPDDRYLILIDAPEWWADPMLTPAGTFLNVANKRDRAERSQQARLEAEGVTAWLAQQKPQAVIMHGAGRGGVTIGGLAVAVGFDAVTCLPGSAEWVASAILHDDGTAVGEEIAVDIALGMAHRGWLVKAAIARSGPDYGPNVVEAPQRRLADRLLAEHVGVKTLFPAEPEVEEVAVPSS
jgi:hypothetical protein